ncbi:MAG TPA: RidA family protein [Gemmatimonadales bacterium]|nr:RidA family protein [Gemmatimonadales bacterium]
MSFDIINPDPPGRPRGWNNGMRGPAEGRVLFVAGQTAPQAGGLVAQWATALSQVLAVVHAAGGGPTDIGRMTVYVTSKADYLANLASLGEVHQKAMGKHYPAMSLIEVAALVDDAAVVEIEATAVIP